MDLVIDSPARVRIPHGVSADQLRPLLGYRDTRAAQQLAIFRQSWRGKTLQRDDPDQFAAETAALKAKVDCSALFEDDRGPWTFSGLAPMLADALGLPIRREIGLTSRSPMPWAKRPPEPRYFQMQTDDSPTPGAVDLMLENPHSCVELATGLGKSWVVRQLIREVGRQATVMVPFKHVAYQLLDDLRAHLGPKVGQFFDGKKDSSKLITVATPQSLLRVEPGSTHWDNLSKTRVFIADESHMVPVETTTKVCLGLLADAPWRWFFSGTQMRGDGRQIVLDGITGPCVMRIGAREGIERGLLARPEFRMIRLRSTSTYSSHDVNREIRHHLYENPGVVQPMSRMISGLVSSGTKVLALLDEVGQVPGILPHLRHPAQLAHGGQQEKNGDLPPEMRKSDPLTLVKRFNAGEFPLLLGTSCVGTGVDFKPQGPMAMAWWVGGQSEIPFRQGVGRALRKEGKDSVTILIPDVVNVPSLHRHADVLRGICGDIWERPKEVDLT